MGCGVRAAIFEALDCSIREVPAGLEIRPPRKDADAIAIISEQQHL